MSSIATIIPDALQPYVPFAKAIVLALAILIGGWLATKLLVRFLRMLLRRRQVDETVVRFLGNLLFWAGLAATIIAALGAVGVETTSFVALLATAGLAVGLALQGSLSNFASGVLILIMRPLRIGDVVTVQGRTGRVEDIGLFATTLVTLDNEQVTIPNAKITGDVVVNMSVLGKRRGAVDVGVAYGTDLKLVRDTLLQAAQSVPEVLEDPEPAVAFVEFGDSSLNFTLFAWSTPENYLSMLSNLKLAVNEAFEKANIEIPFPQLVLHKSS